MVGHTHTHDLGPTPRGVKILLASVIGPLAVLTITGLVMLWPTGEVRESLQGFAPGDTRGEVVEVGQCDEPSPPECRAGTIELTVGEEAPGTVRAILPFGEDAPRVDVGDHVILAYVAEAPRDQRYSFQDFDRTRTLGVLLLLFVAGVLLLSRLRGVGALVSLALSIGFLVVFTLPALAEGSPPLLVAIVTAAAIMTLTLYLSHGFTLQTSIALLGTLLALVATGVLGSLFTAAGRFTGMSEDSSQYIAAINTEVEVGGLLLAGLVIGALGVLDDVTVTQTAAVWELADADPDASRRSLFVRGMRIGRSHVASTVNTLALAYIGATLPLFLVFSTISTPFAVAVSNELVAQEIVRGLVGGIGIVLAVPLTTAIAAWIAGRLVEGTLRREGAGVGRPRPSAASRG
jgi:uncharacterized membrane protein